MTFSEAPWAVRFGEMGDMSERKFLEAVEGKAHRFGLDRPEGVHVPSLPQRLAAMPDFLTTKALVECMGLGRKQQLQMKLTKLNVLHFWRNLHPVVVWVWDSHKKRSCLITVQALDQLIQTPDLCEFHYFDERKLVFAIPADSIWEASDLDVGDLT